MHNLFLNLLTRENISLILSIIGSVGAVSSWIYNYVTRRKNITFRIINHDYEIDDNYLSLYFHLTNNSELPITINEICIEQNSEEVCCSLVPDSFACIGEEDITSVSFPLSVAPLCSCSGYLHFVFPHKIEEDFSKIQNFVIRTNRGKALKERLSLGEENPYIKV